MRVMREGLLEKIHRREARVGVVGLGYVGLPLGIAFARAGFQVTGLDVDARRCEQLSRGESYIRTVPAEPLGEVVRAGQLGATTDFSRVAELDCLVVCVPTPLTAAREPDMQFVVAAGEALRPYLQPGQLVVLESTTWPGTTDEVLRPILERDGLRAGADFHLAFSPEREDPGNPHFDTRTIPKVVGADDPQSRALAEALYGSALDRVVPVTSTRVAELSKLLENIFRCVNIALVNELKMLCDRMGLDVWEVVQAASTKPFGFMPFYPGPGLGGHCIPIDPFYLSWKARQFEFQTRFIELAGEVNTHMPHYVVQRVMEALNARQRSLKGAKVLVLGAAYKKDVDDVRESPSLRILQLLRDLGAEVAYHDPYVPELPAEHGLPPGMRSLPLSPGLLAASDVALVLTDHSCVDYAEVVAHAPLVVDTRNATARVTDGREKIVKA